MLTIDQRSEFDRLGIVRLPGAIPNADVECMREGLWGALGSQHGVLREAPETWIVPMPAGFQALVRSGAFAPMASGPVCEALDDLLGPGAWRQPGRWGQPLVSFPRRGPWDVPHKHWHLDVVADAPISELPGVQIFTYLNSVESQGGGTVVVTGSHRLVEALGHAHRCLAPTRSAEIRKALVRAEPWIEALCSQNEGTDRGTFMAEHVGSDGTTLQVVELTGEPGDVVLMDLRLLHAFAPNCRTIPRLMFAQRIYRVQ